MEEQEKKGNGNEKGSVPVANVPYQPLVVKAQNLGQAWEKAVRMMMSWGYSRFVQAPEYQTWTKDSPMFIMVKEPMEEPRLSPKAPITRSMADEYAHSLVHGFAKDKENSYEYTYYSRLRHYPDCMVRAGLPHISGDERETKEYVNKVSGGKCIVQRLDQVAEAIKIFKKDPTRRTVVLNTWIPFRDLAKFTPERVDTSSPCLVILHPQIVEDRLHLNVVMKTNDLYSAWAGNAYAFTALQKYMAEQIGVGVGHYTHFSVSMQVYQEVFGAAKSV
jgi:thymidylate synthase